MFNCNFKSFDSLDYDFISTAFERDQNTGKLLHRMVVKENQLFLEKNPQYSILERIKLWLGISDGSLNKVTSHLKIAYQKELIKEAALSRRMAVEFFIQLFDLNIQSHNTNLWWGHKWRSISSIREENTLTTQIEDHVNTLAQNVNRDHSEYCLISKNLKHIHSLMEKHFLAPVKEHQYMFREAIQKHCTQVKTALKCYKEKAKASILTRQAAIRIQHAYRQYRKQIEVLKKAIQFDQAARKIQHAYRLSKKQSITDKILFQNQKKHRILTENELKAGYAKLGVLGGGGEGAVFLVKDRAKEKLRALKISYSRIAFSQERGIAYALHQMLEHRVSPHVTQLEEVLEVRGLTSKKLDCKSKVEFFMEDSTDPTIDNPWIVHRKVTLMEVMEGDLEQLVLHKSIRQMELLSYLFQKEYTSCRLNSRFGVYVRDDKYRNVLYKNLKPEDTFAGQQLMNYDYWKYSFAGKDFYLPRPRHLIKYADYDQWQIGKPDSLNTEKELSRLKDAWNYELGALSFEDALTYFCKKPSGNARILDIC